MPRCDVHREIGTPRQDLVYGSLHEKAGKSFCEVRLTSPMVQSRSNGDDKGEVKRP